MQKSTLILILATLVSCKKDPHPVPEDSVKTCRIVSELVNETGEINTYSYDSQGRLTSVTNKEGLTTLRFLWNTGFVEVEEKYIAFEDTVTRTWHCLLGLNDNVVKEYLIGKADTTLYTYDHDGFLSSRTNGANLTSYYFQNGNLLSAVNNLDTLDYSYDTTRMVPKNFEWFLLFGQAYPGGVFGLKYGKPSKNLCLKILSSNYGSDYVYEAFSGDQVIRFKESQLDLTGMPYGIWTHELTIKCR